VETEVAVMNFYVDRVVIRMMIQTQELSIVICVIINGIAMTALIIMNGV